MMGAAAVAVVPRQPLDRAGCCVVGGNLSNPFRRAILWFAGFGLIRTLACHFHHPDSVLLATIDGVLGTIQTTGQTFLCLTTAYLLQTQLSCMINVMDLWRGLQQALAVVVVLVVCGQLLASQLQQPEYYCLVSLAEVISCVPVLQTLGVYGRLTTSSGRGNVLLQILVVVEVWFLATAVVAFVGEALQIGVEADDDTDPSTVQILFETFRQNQDAGVNDWTRLMAHSIFLNAIDEISHFQSFGGNDGRGYGDNGHGGDAAEESNQSGFSPRQPESTLTTKEQNESGKSLVVRSEQIRRRADHIGMGGNV